jgi:flagellar biosynthetic protein FliP/flagellar biosynthetic protein FliQ
LFLTFFIMSPVLNKVNQEALQPYMAEQISARQALENARKPVHAFMIAQTRESDLDLFFRISGAERVMGPEDVPFSILMPAFITSELKTAFQIGFIIFIPFLVIDIVVASVLMAMGMMMLSPLIISLPFKIMLFVLVDGWGLIIGTLAASFGMTQEVVLDLFGSAFFLTVIMVLVIVGPSLLVGLVVSTFQAATQINEQTLSFLPRLIVTLATIMMTGPWLVGQLTDLFERLMTDIPNIIG